MVGLGRPGAGAASPLKGRAGSAGMPAPEQSRAAPEAWTMAKQAGQAVATGAVAARAVAVVRVAAVVVVRAAVAARSRTIAPPSTLKTVVER